MANENVKIIVQEVDETRPRGSGASSDIVYVPGLVNPGVDARYRNVPVLCSTIDEFTRCFGGEKGSEIFRFTGSEDTLYNGALIAHSGECDRSYIYAKELINAGLSVLYEAITEDPGLVNIGSFEATSRGINRVNNTTNMFTAKDSSEETIKFKLVGLPAYGKVSIIPKVTKGDAVVKITEIEPELSAEKLTCIIQEAGTAQLTWKNLESAEFRNIEFTATVSISAECSFTMNMVEGDVSSVALLQDKSPIEYFYSELPERLNNLRDKNEYTVKYITSGGYPSFIEDDNGDYPLVTSMLNCAGTRNDAVALIDHPDDSSVQHGTAGEFYQSVNTFFASAENTEFGAMFTPWGDYRCSTVADVVDNASSVAMPASFGYLLCLASAIKTSPNWLAMAGVTRGIVPNLRGLRTDRVLSNVIAEDYQPKYGKELNKIAINAITNVKPYGLTIWGNRTLKVVDKDGTVATNFLNIRNMMSDIKKLAYNTAKSLMFEQDSDTLWLSFKSGVSPLLDQLKSGSGISDYKLIKNTTKYDGKPLTRGEMSAVIKIFPLYAIEYFEITVVVSDNDVAIS